MHSGIFLLCWLIVPHLSWCSQYERKPLDLCCCFLPRNPQIYLVSDRVPGTCFLKTRGKSLESWVRPLILLRFIQGLPTSRVLSKWMGVIPPHTHFSYQMMWFLLLTLKGPLCGKTHGHFWRKSLVPTSSLSLLALIIDPSPEVIFLF